MHMADALVTPAVAGTMYACSAAAAAVQDTTAILPDYAFRFFRRKIVITSDTPKPFYNDDGILMMNVYDFLLNANSLEL